MRGQRKIEAVLVAGGCAPSALARDALAGWQQRWRDVYAAELHAATGARVHLGFDWHVFSYGYIACAQGDDARAAFRRLEPGSFIVLSACDADCFGFACTGKPPERLDANIDVTISADSLDWTMAFTHEAPVFGPYFATR